MPKPHSKTSQKNRAKKQVNNKSKVKPEPVSITKSKFYWIGLSIVTILAIVAVGFFSGIEVQKVALILVTVISVLAFAWYLRVKLSVLTSKTRATYIFVGAAAFGFGIWAVLAVTLAVTGLGVQLGNVWGDQLFIVTSQVIFIVIGSFVGEYLSTNNTFQAFVGKIRQKYG